MECKYLEISFRQAPKKTHDTVAEASKPYVPYLKKQSMHLAFFIFCKLERRVMQKIDHIYVRNKEMTSSRQCEVEESIAPLVTKTIQTCLMIV
jgi:hypothetical protein